MRLLVWLLPLSFLGSIPGLASAAPARELGAAEDEAEPKLVREYRERLSSGSFRETTKVIAEMQKAPHSTWAELLFEALLRSVRSVAMAQQQLPDAEAMLTELQLQRKAAKASTSPSQVRRLDDKLADAQAEFDETQATLTIQLRSQDVLLKGIGQVAAVLGAESRTKLSLAYGGRLRRLRDPVDRVVLLRAMGYVSGPHTTLALMQVVRDSLERPDSVVAALDSLARLAEPSCLPAAVEALDHKDWRVRSEAVEVMRIVHRRTSIPFLVQRLQVADGRLRDDIGRALNSLTGQKFSPEPRFWKKWWEESRDSFEMPDAPAEVVVDVEEAEGGVHFYGIATYSKRVVFVLDVSGSMAEPARDYGGSGKTQSRKIDVARRNLRGALMALPPDAVFNVLLYADQVMPLYEEVQEATQENKQDAIDRVMAREPQGGTNIYAGVVEIFEQSRTKRRTRRDASPRVDTVYFLTDGRPTVGSVRRADLILEEAETRNALEKIRIHSVGVGSHDKSFMRRLAEENGGTYISQ